VEKDEGEKRLRLVIEILGETDLKRLQELIDCRNGDGGKLVSAPPKSPIIGSTTGSLL